MQFQKCWFCSIWALLVSLQQRAVLLSRYFTKHHILFDQKSIPIIPPPCGSLCNIHIIISTLCNIHIILHNYTKCLLHLPFYSELFHSIRNTAEGTILLPFPRRHSRWIVLKKDLYFTGLFITYYLHHHKLDPPKKHPQIPQSIFSLAPSLFIICITAAASSFILFEWCPSFAAIEK